MAILHKIFSPLIEFVFPLSERALRYSQISAGGMINKFPRAKSLPENMVAIFDYQDKEVRELIWQIKYKGNDEVITKISQILYEVICIEIAERALFENFRDALLIPIPSSNKRIKEKGFNQTELICQKISAQDANNLLKYYPDILIKTRHTESQTKTETRKERLENLKNSMEVKDKSKLHNKCVVLIDDVITTGATISEAKRAMKEAGVRKIIAVSIAH